MGDVTRNCSIVLGDFNVDISLSLLPDHFNTLVNDFRALHFFPTIALPTRSVDGSATTMHYIWFTPCTSGVITLDISDHYPIFISVPHVLHRKNELIKTQFRCQKFENVVRFRRVFTSLYLIG